ncbi:hypothetical protein L1049_026148 [Liquidambar formosana]|uniref:DUF668 domain-containing protein n=1 Tax=Liquidambar formosana TaxID=63359 RepID=A0AAP0R584_LIQFO
MDDSLVNLWQASRPTCLPPNMRDTLYHGLPASVKTALRSQLQTIESKEELTVPLVKAEMEKTLQWLVPIAANTTKAHQGFGWVGEWANSGNEFGKKTAAQSNLIRLQTLYHADKQKIDLYILELVTWLHHLISLVRHRDHIFKPLPNRSPTSKGLVFQSNLQRLPSLNYNAKTHGVQLSQEERNLVEDVCQRRLFPGLSKSQEFVVAKNRGTKVWALSRSTGSSPSRELSKTWDLEHPRTNVFDVADGLNTTF